MHHTPAFPYAYNAVGALSILLLQKKMMMTRSIFLLEKEDVDAIEQQLYEESRPRGRTSMESDFFIDGIIDSPAEEADDEVTEVVATAAEAEDDNMEQERGEGIDAAKHQTPAPPYAPCDIILCVLMIIRPRCASCHWSAAPHRWNGGERGTHSHCSGRIAGAREG